jgi:hypothetical protein
MRYYLVTRENSTKEDPFQLTSDRTTGIVFIQPISDVFNLNMINKMLNSVSIDFKLNNSDKQSLDNHGISLVYQYPKNQIWIYDIKNKDNLFLIQMIRESRINELV